MVVLVLVVVFVSVFAGTCIVLSPFVHRGH
jgi:hypothetical protein